MNKSLNEEVEEFKSRKVCKLERLREIYKRTRDLRRDLAEGKISAEKHEEEVAIFDKELLPSQIVFDNIEDFTNFTNILGFGFTHQIEHEIQHSIPYKKANVQFYFGWQNIMDDTFGEVGHIFVPFCVPYGKVYTDLSRKDRDFLRYTSLIAVSEPSDKDRKDTNLLEEIYGDEIKNAKTNRFLR